MTLAISNRCKSPLLCSLILAASLAACGGGGGSDDGGSGPPSSIDVTVANQDTLTRAGMVTVQAVLIGGSLGITASGPSSPMAVGAVRRALLAGIGVGAAQRERPAAVIGPVRVDCAVSGFGVLTLDDRDNNQVPSVGDAISVSFSDCSDLPGEVLNGGMGATYTQIVASPITVGATVSASNLSVSEPTRSAVLNGNFAFAFQQASATVETLRMVVSNSLALRVTTPVFSDTITMLDGCTVDSSYDVAALPPGGGIPGRSTTTANGQVASAAAGGAVRIGTLDPIVQYDADDYPRAGRIEVVGRTGSLQATALSTTQLRIDLDADGNGAFEASRTLLWTQLF